MKAELLNHSGTDLTVVNAARVSFDKEHKEFDSEKDSKLIHYLAIHGHWTPFSHCTITVRETIPIFVARQRIRHTVGFSYNEVSRRYVETEPEFYVPVNWRAKAENKKQGSSDEVICTEKEVNLEKYHKLSLDFYNNLLKLGVCPEQARIVLPLSTYTSWYVTGSLYAWARAYNLRSEAHAQKEIQELAKQWKEILEPLYPVSWKALTNGSV